MHRGSWLMVGMEMRMYRCGRLRACLPVGAPHTFSHLLTPGHCIRHTRSHSHSLSPLSSLRPHTHTSPHPVHIHSPPNLPTSFQGSPCYRHIPAHPQEPQEAIYGWPPSSHPSPNTSHYFFPLRVPPYITTKSPAGSCSHIHFIHPEAVKQPFCS